MSTTFLLSERHFYTSPLPATSKYFNTINVHKRIYQNQNGVHYATATTAHINYFTHLEIRLQISTCSVISPVKTCCELLHISLHSTQQHT